MTPSMIEEQALKKSSKKEGPIACYQIGLLLVQKNIFSVVQIEEEERESSIPSLMEEMTFQIDRKSVDKKSIDRSIKSSGGNKRKDKLKSKSRR